MNRIDCQIWSTYYSKSEHRQLDHLGIKDHLRIDGYNNTSYICAQPIHTAGWPFLCHLRVATDDKSDKPGVVWGMGGVGQWNDWPMARLSPICNGRTCWHLTVVSNPSHVVLAIQNPTHLGDTPPSDRSHFSIQQAYQEHVFGASPHRRKEKLTRTLTACCKVS